MKTTRATFALLSMSLAAFAAQATVTTYSSWGAFSSAVPTAVVHDFSGMVLPSSPTVGPQTLAGVTFDSTVIAFGVYGGPGRYSGGNFFSGQSNTLAPSDVIVTLGGQYAFALTYGAYATTPGTPVTITLSNGDMFSQLLPPNAGIDTNFFGFVSTTPIASLTLQTIANVAAPPPYAYSLDVVSFATAVPEASTWAMMMLGLGCMGAAARRQRG